MKNSQAKLLELLLKDLTAKHGRGFSRQGLQKMRAFYLGGQIFPTLSGKLEARAKISTVSGDRGRETAETVFQNRDKPEVNKGAVEGGR